MGLVLVFRGTEAMAKLVQRGDLAEVHETDWVAIHKPARRDGTKGILRRCLNPSSADAHAVGGLVVLTGL